MRLPDPVILEDRGAFIVVNKPHGLPVHAVAGADCVLARLRVTTSAGELHLCHRLDATTGGELLLARTAEGAARAAAEFEGGRVEKAYLAVCRGVPQWEDLDVEAPLTDDAGTARVDPAGRPARTGFHVVARGRDAALVVARPRTGRFHQVRVHLAHAGHPVVGDRRYGGGAAPCVALHAAWLSLSPTGEAPLRALALPWDTWRRAASRVGLGAADVSLALGLAGTP